MKSNPLGRLVHARLPLSTKKDAVAAREEASEQQLRLLRVHIVYLLCVELTDALLSLVALLLPS